MAIISILQQFLLLNFIELRYQYSINYFDKVILILNELIHSMSKSISNEFLLLQFLQQNLIVCDTELSSIFGSEISDLQGIFLRKFVKSFYAIMDLKIYVICS